MADAEKKKKRSSPARGADGPRRGEMRQAGARPAAGRRRMPESAKVIPLRGAVRASEPALYSRGRGEVRAKRARPARLNGLSLLIGGLALTLCLFGLLMIYSASSSLSSLQYGNGLQFLWRQTLCMAVGMVFMVGLARIDYRRLMELAPLLMGAAMLLLILVLIPPLGIMANGSRRFLRPGLQPSEMAKLAFILFAAQQLSRRDRDMRKAADLLPILGVAALTGLLIMLEPDLGTTGIFMLVLLAMMVVAGCRWSHLITLTSLSGTAAALLVYMEPYRFQRLFSFLHPWDDPQGSGFQLIQSLLALGSGGMGGFNLGMSRQKFMYLPNAHNDFIFSIIGEELGFLGTMFVVSLFVALLFAGTKAAREAPDRAGRLLAVGITVLLTGQAFVNMGAVSGVLPITGVTLPLISYGGTSAVIFLSLLGILMNIAVQGKASATGRKARGGENEDSDMRRRHRRSPLSSAGPRRGTGVA